MNPPAWSPWAAFFTERGSPKWLRANATSIPELASDVEKYPTDIAGTLVAESLCNAFVPTDKTLEPLLRILGIAAAEAMTRYPDVPTFVRRVNETQFHARPERMTCFTGIGGHGKTAISDALRRVAITATPIAIPGHGTHQHVPIAFFKPAEKWSAGEIARQLGVPADRSIEPCRWLFARGCCTTVMDEMQFLTRGESVVRSATLINSVARQGPPVVFMCNYSLVHKLMKRPQEERDRMLADPIVLVPDPPESDGWLALMVAWETILSRFCDFSLRQRANDFWCLIAGNKRYGIHLLRFAFEAAHKDGRKMRWQDIEDCYSGPRYSEMRRTVEELASISIGRVSSRRDLVCPFETSASVEYSRILRDIEKMRHAHATARESLSVPQQRRLSQMEAQADESGPKSRQASRRRMRPATAEDLAKAAVSFAGSV